MMEITEKTGYAQNDTLVIDESKSFRLTTRLQGNTLSL